MRNQKNLITILLTLTFAFFVFGTSSLYLNQPDSLNLEQYREISDFVDENEKCFKCHGVKPLPDQDQTEDPSGERPLLHVKVRKREIFYKSNHKSLACMDCHYLDEQVPDEAEIKTDKLITCNDCHAYIEEHQHYQFEKIGEEYLQSVHQIRKPDEFTCWNCHDAHSYYISMRNTENIQASIAYDNMICLSCHMESVRFNSEVSAEILELAYKHEWLPEQTKHFKQVRCIDCHTRINDQILVAHHILPKEEAVQRCSECHSKNSLLLATLYKYRVTEARNKYGFFNAIVMNDVFLVGANRSKIINLLCLIIFGLTLAGIFVHILFRFKGH